MIEDRKQETKDVKQALTAAGIRSRVTHSSDGWNSLYVEIENYDDLPKAKEIVSRATTNRRARVQATLLLHRRKPQAERSQPQ